MVRLTRYTTDNSLEDSLIRLEVYKYLLKRSLIRLNHLLREAFERPFQEIYSPTFSVFSAFPYSAYRVPQPVQTAESSNSSSEDRASRSPRVSNSDSNRVKTNYSELNKRRKRVKFTKKIVNVILPKRQFRVKNDTIRVRIRE
jgi:hypothetical protein